MIIHGLQKMTLLDYPGRVACTVFLGGCDMRCPFCHNAELNVASAPAALGEAELLSFLATRRGLLDGVAVTGGEPLLRGDLALLLGKIRAMGFEVKLDTNGTHPESLRALLEQDLVQYVAMDIKNSPAHYAATVGVPGFDLSPVRRSVELLMSSPCDYEFRTTVVREFHDEESFHQIGAWIQGAKRYFLQPFTDRETVPDRTLHAPQPEDLKRYEELLRAYVPSVRVRGE